MVAGRVSHFTHGALSSLRCAQRLLHCNVNIFFRGSGVGALSRSTRLHLAVVSSVTRSRLHGLDSHIGFNRRRTVGSGIILNGDHVFNCIGRSGQLIVSRDRTPVMQGLCHLCTASRCDVGRLRRLFCSRNCHGCGNGGVTRSALSNVVSGPGCGNCCINGGIHVISVFAGGRGFLSRSR